MNRKHMIAAAIQVAAGLLAGPATAAPQQRLPVAVYSQGQRIGRLFEMERRTRSLVHLFDAGEFVGALSVRGVAPDGSMLVVGNEYSGWVRLDGSAVEGTPDGAVGTLLKHESGLAAERSAEAMRLLHSGHPAQAVQLLEAAAVLDSENPQALARVGLAHFNSGRPLAAIACMRQAQAKARVQGNTWLADALDAFVLQAQERSAALGGVDAPLASSPPSGVTEGFCEIPQ